MKGRVLVLACAHSRTHKWLYAKIFTLTVHASCYIFHVALQLSEGCLHESHISRTHKGNQSRVPCLGFEQCELRAPKIDTERKRIHRHIFALGFSMAGGGGGEGVFQYVRIIVGIIAGRAGEREWPLGSMCQQTLTNVNKMSWRWEGTAPHLPLSHDTEYSY